MAGLGRRSHYRKHLTDAVLNDLPEPDEALGLRIARVVGTRGGNMFDVVVAPLSTSNKESDKKEEQAGKEEEGSDDKIILELPPSLDEGARTQQLAFLPTKFRKLVWIKRNDFVIVQCGEEESAEQSDQKDSGSSGFRYVITHILYKDQVKHIKSKNLWPTDPYFADDDPAEYNDKGKNNIENGDVDDDAGAGDGTDNNDNESVEAGYEDDDGIVFDDPLDDEYMINTNRVARLTVDDSSSDEDSD